MTDKKYIKLKNKYLKLKKYFFQNGGQIDLKSIKKINLFTDPDMEQFLNPIYGLIMNKTCYFENIFTLGSEIENIDSENSIIEEYKIIKSIVSFVNNEHKPSNVILRQLTPIKIGKYIALLYHYKNNPVNDVNVIFNNTIADMDIRDIFNGVRSRIKINKQIKLGETNQNIFHLLLYCLWRISDSIENIKEYYNGINDTFSTLNRINCECENLYTLIEFDEDTFIEYSPEEIIPIEENTNFNRAVFNILSINNFEQINYSRLENPNDNDNDKTFSDCVETGLRNFINILIFNGKSLDLEKLRQLGAISELVIYYQKYSNFKLLFTNNARKEWIILLGGTSIKNNINFRNRVEEGIHFNIISSIANFKQILINLFAPEIVDESINIFQILQERSGSLIENIEVKKNDDSDEDDENDSEDRKDIFIKNINLEVQKFSIIKGHLLFKYIQSKSIYENYVSFYVGQNIIHKSIIEILFHNNEGTYNESILENNKYLHNKIQFKNITKIINFKNDEEKYNEFKLNMLIIGLKYSEFLDDDDVQYIEIPQIYANYLISKNFFKDEFNKYLIIILDNLDFILLITDLYMIPRLKANQTTEHLYFTDNIVLELETIGNNFLIGSSHLKTIDLLPFQNVKTIGNNFLYNCNSLETINLSSLRNVETIGSSFLFGCNSLETIDLLSLRNIKTISNNFLFNCSSLKIIDLSPLINVETIGDDFLFGCNSLETIDLSPLQNVKTIGDDFLKYCTSLKIISLPILIRTIGNSFLYNCRSLEDIDLLSLRNVETIGKHFLSGCSKLKNIYNILSLINLTNIGDYFLSGCNNLTIDLSQLETLKEQFKSNGHNFLSLVNLINNLRLRRILNL